MATFAPTRTTMYPPVWQTAAATQSRRSLSYETTLSPQRTESERVTCPAEGTRPHALLYSHPVTRSIRKNPEGTKREECHKNAVFFY